MSKTGLRFKLLDLIQTDALLLKELIVLKRVVPGVEAIVRGTMSLFEARVLFISVKGALKHSSEVDSREDAVVRDKVISEVRLITIGMRKAGSVGVSQEKRHKCISVINGI